MCIWIVRIHHACEAAESARNAGKKKLFCFARILFYFALRNVTHGHRWNGRRWIDFFSSFRTRSEEKVSFFISESQIKWNHNLRAVSFFFLFIFTWNKINFSSFFSICYYRRLRSLLSFHRKWNSIVTHSINGTTETTKQQFHSISKKKKNRKKGNFLRSHFFPSIFTTSQRAKWNDDDAKRERIEPEKMEKKWQRKRKTEERWMSAKQKWCEEP